MATVDAEIQTKARIDVATAARAARDYFRKIYPLAQKCSIEEVESTEDEKYWLITLGYEPAAEEKRKSYDFLPLPSAKYKVFKVDAHSGKVLSMKIRSIG